MTRVNSRSEVAGSKLEDAAKSRSAAATRPLEYNILLTATLCLLAFGAVMVYSASSARTLLQGQGEAIACHTVGDALVRAVDGVGAWTVADRKATEQFLRAVADH